MIRVKDSEDIKNLKSAGIISQKIIDTLLEMAKPGVSLLEIDQTAEKLLKENNSVGWFKEVGNYQHVTCISVNDVWLHGIPDDTKIQKNDIVSIDLGVK